MKGIIFTRRTTRVLISVNQLRRHGMADDKWELLEFLATTSRFLSSSLVLVVNAAGWNKKRKFLTNGENMGFAQVAERGNEAEYKLF